MKFDTRLTFFFKNFYKQGKKKFNFFQIHFTNSIFFLLFGFLVGNLFGSLLNIFQESILWHGFITIIIIFLVELSNYLIYNPIFRGKRITPPKMAPRETVGKGFEKNVNSRNKVRHVGEPMFYTKCQNGKVILHRFRKEKIQLFRFTLLEENLLKNVFYYQYRYFKFPFTEKKKKKFFYIDILRLHLKPQSQQRRNFFHFLGFKGNGSSLPSQVTQKGPMTPLGERSYRPLSFLRSRKLKSGDLLGFASLGRLLYLPLASLEKRQNFFKKRPNLMDTVMKSLNLFKIGILLGFFIDAFKVGS